MNAFQVFNGKPMEPGAVLVDGGVNFTLFSRNATRVVLDLFNSEKDKQPSEVVELDPSKNRTGDMWHVFIKGLKAGALYLYQVDGPYNPPQGHRFNFNKFLLDPYAKALTKGSVFLSYNKQREEGLAGIENGRLSDLSAFPRCVVIDDCDFDWEGDKPLNYPLDETIIYETHVKGFTASKTAGVKHPGTFKGFMEKIPYLKELGITSVEFQPVFEFDENENGNINPRTGEKLKNYWGYSPMSFFAPKATYSSDQTPGGAVREFKELVREMHKAGIEIILDVVYNHTAEGNEQGTTFEFRGIENSVYYLLPGTEKQYYTNYSGCGNTFNCNHPIVRSLILQSLRHWVLDMHVDGFRFDLASILSRAQNGILLNFPPLPNVIAEDPILSNTKIIAEPWDAGGGYQQGRFPGGRWCEWNGRFRDDIRRFVRGDEHVSTEAATRIAGSSDLYKDSGRKPVHSINFVTAHDGFTMNDLVSYNNKHNDENGEDGRDGSDNNLSYNYGFEGASINPKIDRMRVCKIKNFMLFLLLSQGTPMILAGDEMRRSQGGNNNVYCQDTSVSWMDWTDEKKCGDILRFTRLLIQLRKNHPVFHRDRFFPESTEKDEQPEIAWFDRECKVPDWSLLNRFLAFRLKGSACTYDDGTTDNDFYIASNSDIYDMTLILPTLPRNKKWFVVADTSVAGPEGFAEEGNELPLEGQQRYVLPAGGSVILMSKEIG